MQVIRRTRCQHQPQGSQPRWLRQPALQPNDIVDRRQPITPTLLAGRNRYGSPVSHTPRSPLALELQHPAPGGHRHETCYAEFDGLLQRHIHLVGRLQRLHQRNVDARFAFDFVPFNNLHPHLLAQRRDNTGHVFTTLTIKKCEPIALAQAKDATGMASGGGGKIDDRTNRER